jgi:hypothetical protein
MLTEHTHSTEGLLTHVGMSDCFITLPHPALECGIVTAWWQCQVEGGQGGHGCGAATSGTSLASDHLKGAS